MDHLTVGLGEVGIAINAIVGGQFYSRHESNWDQKHVDVAHICIPYSDSFKTTVEKWKEEADLVIVHSTTPFGTCDDLEVVHSPIRGVHPHLEKGIRTFVKYFGGKDADKAAQIFADLGLKTKVFKEAKATEALKLWDTTQYGRLIMLEKEIYEWCVKHNVDYEDVYKQANQDYNDGYVKLGRPDVVRPWLTHKEGPIGGHCVVPNAKLLGVDL
jgi:UDP-N-acetyl-D-mannosaminuronate dehydrogenase